MAKPKILDKIKFFLSEQSQQHQSLQLQGLLEKIEDGLKNEAPSIKINHLISKFIKSQVDTGKITAATELNFTFKYHYHVNTGNHPDGSGQFYEMYPYDVQKGNLLHLAAILRSPELVNKALQIGIAPKSKDAIGRNPADFLYLNRIHTEEQGAVYEELKKKLNPFVLKQTNPFHKPEGIVI